MITISTKFKIRYLNLIRQLVGLILGIIIPATSVVAQHSAHRQHEVDSVAANDTITLDKMSKTLPRLQRGVNVWHDVIPAKLNVGGSSTIYSEDVNTTPVSNITNVLSGRLPGLYTQQLGGEAGLDASVLQLRGQTPIIVVDGIVRSYTSFNPNEIKSITVMKDAVSAAMFGFRSSKGVVYITTKDGPEAKPFELNFSAQYGFLDQLSRPKFVTGAAYASLYDEAQQNTNPGSTSLFSAAAIAAYQNGTNDPYLQPSTSWYNLVYKNNTNQQRYTIDVAGAGKSYHYFAAIEDFSQAGNFITNSKNVYNTSDGYGRYNIRTNFETNFNDQISLTLNVFGSFENFNQPGVGSAAIMSRIYATSPLGYAPRNADGSFGGNPLYTTSVSGVNYGTNILASTISSGYLNTNQRTLNADATLLFKLDDIAKGLWLKGTASINNFYQETVNRSKTFATYNPTAGTTGTTYTKIGSGGVVAPGGAKYSIGSQFRQDYANLSLGYDRQFGDHQLSLLASFNSDNTLNSLTQLNQLYNTAGLVVRYNYKQTYLVDIAATYDSFNRFPPGKRWGFLPSAGLGWILSNEQWFTPGAVTFLKLHGSVGQTAWADPSNYYLYLQKYNLNIGSTYYFGTNATAVSGTTEGPLTNPDITWEKAWKYEIGADAAFLNNTLNAGLTYYHNRYYDLLQQKGDGNGSSILGAPYPLENVGKQTFSGFEATASYHHGQANGFSYQVGANVSVEKSNIVSADEGAYPYPWLYRAGSPVNQIRGYEASGFYSSADVSKVPGISGYTPQAGDIKYKDLNGDGVVNYLDEKVIGNTKPRILTGLNFGLSYHRFDLSGLFQGVLNSQIMLNPAAMQAFSNQTGYVLNYTTDNHWTPQNSVNAALPRLTLGTNINNQLPSTFWLRNANYVRLKNAELGYTFRGARLKRAKISGLRIFVNAYNLMTFTPLKYIDPESGLSGFPVQRVINTGVSLKL